jgi:multiple sugar transport system substrate-binding protein/raffinose/stachyose/melibiose transport system substrate-binding protein
MKRHSIILAVVLALLLGPPALARAEAPQQVTFLHYWTGHMSGGIDAAAAAFNTSQNRFRLRASGFEHESFKIGIKVMLESGNPPDMFSYWAGARTQALVDAGLLAPLDDAWAAAGLDQRFPPQVAAACTYSGHKYAVPLTQHWVGLFYNVSLFKKLGISPPADWNTFKAACRAIKAAGVAPLALGSRDRWPAQFWYDFLLLRTAGPEWRDKLLAGRASFRAAESRRAFALWKELLDAGYFVPDPNRYDWSEACMMVASGKAAMTLMGTWAGGLYEGQLNLALGRDYDVFPFPAVDPAAPCVSLGPIDAVAVPREGNVDAAKAAAVYFSEQGPQEAMSAGSGALAPSSLVPPSFYGPLQAKVRTLIGDCPRWAFAFDLATPPALATAGLEALAAFLAHPVDLDRILARLDEQAAKTPKPGP